MHGQRAAKASNMRREYWSARYRVELTRGRYGKRLTHRYERRQAKEELRGTVSPYDLSGLPEFPGD